MYIITSKASNKILEAGKSLYYDGTTGYPAFYGTNIHYPIELVNIFKIENLPEDFDKENFIYDGTSFININSMLSTDSMENLSEDILEEKEGDNY